MATANLPTSLTVNSLFSPIPRRTIFLPPWRKRLRRRAASTAELMAPRPGRHYRGAMHALRMQAVRDARRLPRRRYPGLGVEKRPAARAGPPAGSVAPGASSARSALRSRPAPSRQATPQNTQAQKSPYQGAFGATCRSARPSEIAILVRTERLELSHLAAPEPKSGVSTNFTTSAKRVSKRKRQAMPGAFSNMGWTMGIEPTTPGATILCSTN